MKHITRDSKGRFAKQYRNATFMDKILVLVIIIFTIGVVINEEVKKFTQPVYADTTVEEPVEVPTPKEVRIQVVYDWDEEKIEKEIRDTFVETPNTAVAVAICESQLNIDVQSQHILSYGQEKSFGLFQIHQPDWHGKAIELGLGDYATNPKANIELAKYIYDHHGWKMWSCYKQGLYKKYL